jgi:hypothetical protein
VPSQFGTIITGSVVSQAAIRTLQTFLPDYLGEVAVQSGHERNALEPFNSYVRSNDLEAFPEDHLPACVVMCPGLADNPTRNENYWSASWDLSAVVILSSTDREVTKEMVEIYCAAMRAALLQHPSLPYWDEETETVKTGPAESVVWMDEDYGEADDRDSRTFGVGRVTFEVGIQKVLDTQLGISQPSDGPGDFDGRIIESTHIDVRKVSL